MVVSDFHATFNACLHMHELFTAPCVQSEDVPSLNTRKIPRAPEGGGARGGRGIRVPSCQPWWRLMEAACYLTAALLLLDASPSDRRTEITAHRRHLLFVSFDSQGRDFHSAEVGSPKKKKKKKKYGFLCDRTAATASAFRQTVTQKSAKREDYRVSVLLCQSRLPLKYHVGGSVWTSSLSSCMFSTRVFNYFYIFLGYICI